MLIPAGSPPIYRTDNVLAELQRLAALDVRHLLTPHFGGIDSAPPSDFLARNVESVKTSRSRIEEMFTQGLEFPQVVEKLRAGIIKEAEESGRARSDIPDFLADVWLRIMLRTGLMGYMADSLEYAREFRPFRDPVGRDS